MAKNNDLIKRVDISTSEERTQAVAHFLIKASHRQPINATDGPYLRNPIKSLNYIRVLYSSLSASNCINWLLLALMNTDQAVSISRTFHWLKSSPRIERELIHSEVVDSLLYFEASWCVDSMTICVSRKSRTSSRWINGCSFFRDYLLLLLDSEEEGIAFGLSCASTDEDCFRGREDNEWGEGRNEARESGSWVDALG